MIRERRRSRQRFDGPKLSLELRLGFGSLGSINSKLVLPKDLKRNDESDRNETHQNGADADKAERVQTSIMLAKVGFQRHGERSRITVELTRRREFNQSSSNESS